MKKMVFVVVLIEILLVLFSKTTPFTLFVRVFDEWDRQAMLFLNYDGGRFADMFWKCVSDKFSCFLMLPVGAYAFVKYRCCRIEILFVVFLLLITVAMCDQLSASFFKPYFARLRPSHDPQLCMMLHYVDGYRGGCYGFVSSHATNVFGVTVFMAMFFRDKFVTISLLLWSLCVSYSRIYLGVHYLGDVLGGCILGATIGLSVYLSAQSIYENFICKLSVNPSDSR